MSATASRAGGPRRRRAETLGGILVWAVLVAATTVTLVSAGDEAGAGFRGLTIPDAPGAPQQVSVRAQAEQLAVAWQPPRTGGPATGYRIRVFPHPGGGSGDRTVGPGRRAVVIHGVVPGVGYQVRVQAVSPTGTGEASPVTVIPFYPPASPENVQVTWRPDRLPRLDWTSRTATAAPVVAYRVAIRIQTRQGVRRVVRQTEHPWLIGPGARPGARVTWSVRAIGPGGRSGPTILVERTPRPIEGARRR